MPFLGFGQQGLDPRLVLTDRFLVGLRPVVTRHLEEGDRADGGAAPLGIQVAGPCANEAQAQLCFEAQDAASTCLSCLRQSVQRPTQWNTPVAWSGSVHVARPPQGRTYGDDSGGEWNAGTGRRLAPRCGQDLGRRRIGWL